jgi:UDP-N-acetylglucosamine 2-epimerase (non-hydrolysing)
MARPKKKNTNPALSMEQLLSQAIELFQEPYDDRDERESSLPSLRAVADDYNKLQMNALAIVSDSGTLPEESSFYLSIGHPIAAVCIRTSTERPEALEAGDFILAGITTDELLNATSMAIEMKRKGVLGKPCPDYVDETVSMKVVRIIQGYVGVVNKMVWRKS